LIKAGAREIIYVVYDCPNSRVIRIIKMQTKAINSVIEEVVRDDGIFEVRVHPFSGDHMGLYEDGIRKALKEKDEKAGNAHLCLDFSELNSMRELDERALFDMFQFVSFNCLRQEQACVHWGQCFLDYLKSYSAQKNAMWKLSSSTVKKLVDANC
jgi:hypothetical protein